MNFEIRISELEIVISPDRSHTFIMTSGSLRGARPPCWGPLGWPIFSIRPSFGQESIWSKPARGCKG